MIVLLGIFPREILLLGIFPKEMKSVSQRDICTPMFIAVLFTIAKTCNQPKCPLTDEWIKKVCCVYVYTYVHTHTMEYYSALKRRKFVTMWMNLEDIMLNEIRQAQKDRYY